MRHLFQRIPLAEIDDPLPLGRAIDEGFPPEGLRDAPMAVGHSQRTCSGRSIHSPAGRSEAGAVAARAVCGPILDALTHASSGPGHPFQQRGIRGILSVPRGTIVGRAETPLTGRAILVVEDEAFLADDLAQILAEQGAQMVGPVGAATRAFVCLRKVRSRRCGGFRHQAARRRCLSVRGTTLDAIGALCLRHRPCPERGAPRFPPEALSHEAGRRAGTPCEHPARLLSGSRGRPRHRPTRTGARAIPVTGMAR